MKSIYPFLLVLSLYQFGYSQNLKTTLSKPERKILSLDARFIKEENVKTKTVTTYVQNVITNDYYDRITDVFIILNNNQKSVNDLFNNLELCLKYMNDTKVDFSVKGNSYTLQVTYDGFRTSLIVMGDRNDQFCAFKKQSVVEWVNWLKTIKF